MTYGKSKERDMVRSILPSSARKAARDNKRAINQRRRSRVRQALRQHRDVLAAEAFTDFDLIEAEEHFFTDTFGGDTLSGEIIGAWDPASEQDVPYAKICDADGDYESEIRYAMWDRRERDKTHPFERWAVARTRHVRKLDRATWLQSKMPDNLAVRHAMSHVNALDEFDVRPNPYSIRYAREGGAREWMNAVRYAHAVEMLYKVATGPLKRFNRFHRRTFYKTVSYVVGDAPKEELPGGWKLNGFEDKRYRASWNSNFIYRRREAQYVKEVEPFMGVHDIHTYIERFTSDAAGYGSTGFTHFETMLEQTFSNYERIDAWPRRPWLYRL